MKYAYPASNQRESLSDALLSLKIARHSPCSLCSSCAGLHPPKGVDIVLDAHTESSLGNLEQYGSDDDEIPSEYLFLCACGHSVKQHHASEHDLGSAEFIRRGRVAIRLDELLEVSPVDSSIRGEAPSLDLLRRSIIGLWQVVGF